MFNIYFSRLFFEYLNKLFSLAAAHSGCETDRWTFLDCSCCICAGGGSECGCFVLSVVVLKLSNEKSLCSDGWYDVAGLKCGKHEAKWTWGSFSIVLFWFKKMLLKKVFKKLMWDFFLKYWLEYETEVA